MKSRDVGIGRGIKEGCGIACVYECYEESNREHPYKKKLRSHECTKHRLFSLSLCHSISNPYNLILFSYGRILFVIVNPFDPNLPPQKLEAESF